MALLRVEGKNILDEGFKGTNVRDTKTGRMSGEGAERLGSSVRSGMQRASSTDRNQAKVSNAIATISKTMGSNTVQIQNLLENQGDETKNEISKLVKMLEKSQKLTGEKSAKAIEQIQQQTEIIKLTAGEQGEDLIKALGIMGAKKDLKSGGSAIKSFFGVDQDAKGLSAVKQAFDPSRMFGTSGFFGLGRNSITEKRAEREGAKQFEAQRQSSGLDELNDNLIKSQEKAESAKKVESVKKEKSQQKFTGSDRKSEDEKQTKFLEKILKELKKLNANSGVAGGGGGGGKSIPGKVVSAVGTGLAAVGTAWYAGKKLLSSRVPDVTSPNKVKPTFQGDPTLDKNGKKLNPSQQAARNQRLAREAAQAKPGTATPRAAPGTKPSMMSRLGKVGKFAARGARFLGPLGALVTAGSAAYAGVKGFNADPNASTGEKFGNAARGIGNMLSFGLIDSPEEAMQKRQLEQSASDIMRPQGEESIMDGFVPNPTSLPDVSPRPLPTGDAIDRVSEATTTINNSPTINNITNNNVSSSGGGSQSNPLIAMKDTIRDGTSVIQQRFNKVYA